MRTCTICRAEYVPANGKQRRCNDCIASPRPCEWCQGPFVSRAVSQRFCSKSCANASSAKRGAAHPNYNHGLTFNRSLGRWVIVCRDRTTMYFARGVMAGHIGRLLTTEELVHHVNEDSTDDRIENLEITTRPEHIRLHMDALIASRAA